MKRCPYAPVEKLLIGVLMVLTEMLRREKHRPTDQD